MISLAEVHPHVAIAFAGEELGNVDPRFGSFTEVRENRLALRAAMPPMSQVYTIIPKGGTDFIDVDSPDRRMLKNHAFDDIGVTGDALITSKRATGLSLHTADCIPLIVTEPEKDILSIIHLGWRGAVHRLHEDVLEYGLQEKGLTPANAIAYLGPSIQKASYLTEKLHDIQQNDEDWHLHIDEAEDGFHVDIPGFVIATLRQYGIQPQNISQCPDDTGAKNSGYYSFTRHKRDNVPNGRNAFTATLV